MASNGINLGDVRNEASRVLINGVRSIFFSSQHHAKVHAAQITIAARKVEEEMGPLSRKLTRLQNEERQLLEKARHYVKNEVYVRAAAKRIEENRRSQDATRRELRRIEKKGKIALDMKRALDAGEDARTAILSVGTKRQQELLQQDLRGLSDGLSGAYEVSAGVKDIACDIEQQFRDEGINSLREDFQDETVALETELEEEMEQERHDIERAEKEREARLKREDLRRASGGDTLAQRYDVDSIMNEIGFSRDANLAVSMPNPPERVPAQMVSNARRGQQRRARQVPQGVDRPTAPQRSLRGWGDINVHTDDKE